MAQQVKDPVLSLYQLRSDPWPGNFHMLQEQPWKRQKDKKKKKKKKIGLDSLPNISPKDSVQENWELGGRIMSDQHAGHSCIYVLLLR